MSKLPRLAAFATLKLANRNLARAGLRPCPSVALLLAMLALAACSMGQPTGPQVQGTTAPAQPQGGVLDFLAANTPTATPSPTATLTPTPTPTPLPTATPLAAQSIGRLPVGQVLFSTQRAGEMGEQLWLVSGDAGLTELHSDLLPAGWRCAPGQPAACVFAGDDQGLFLLRPVTATALLLDDLTPLLAAVSAAPISPTLPITVAGPLSPTLPIAAELILTPTLPLTSTVAITPTTAITSQPPMTPTVDLPAAAAQPSAMPPTLVFSPDGQRLAVAAADRVTIYDLAAPAVLATLDAGGPAELAWSPDGARLGLAYPAADGNALALWNLAENEFRVLAQMEAAGRLAWSPDGGKLAFDARTSPGAPASQGSQSDVYVLYLRGGEIGNLTELFLRNNGVEAASQIAGWAPQWEPDGEAVRYRRGVPGQIEQQNVVRQALRSRTPTTLWPAADEGKLGVLADPGGPGFARVILRDGRDVVQISTAPPDWQDATSGAFADIAALAWAPAGDEDAPRRLLLADRQTLWLLDPATGSLSGLAVACPDCIVTQALWLP